MREAVIVSTARTPIGKAYRGAFNDTQAQTLGGHAIAQRARAAPASRAARSTTSSWARPCSKARPATTSRGSRALRAGLPTSVAGMSVDRQCASGLMAISIAAKEIVSRRHEHRRRRRARVDLAGAERQDEPLPRARPVARRASRRHLHVDARDRRNRRGALQHLARGAGRIRAPVAARTAAAQGCRPLRGRDRPAAHGDEGRRQGDRRRLATRKSR